MNEPISEIADEGIKAILEFLKHHGVILKQLDEAQRKLNILKEIMPHLQIKCPKNPSLEFCLRCDEDCWLGMELKNLLGETSA